MKTTIISKNFGSQVIDTETFCPGLVSPRSTVFKIIEHIFNDWYDHNSQNNRELRAMYFGDGDEPACYSVRGAIIGGIEILIEVIEENKYKVVNTRQIQNFDIECAFQ